MASWRTEHFARLVARVPPEGQLLTWRYELESVPWVPLPRYTTVAAAVPPEPCEASVALDTTGTAAFVLRADIATGMMLCLVGEARGWIDCAYLDL